MAWLATWAVMAAAAEPAARLMPTESQIAFVSKQMGVPVEGQFKRFTAQVAFDPRRPEGGTIALQIDTASAAFGIAQTDAELARPTWFDSGKYPQASFQSSAIKALGAGRFDVLGTLVLKGRTHAILIPVTITQTDGKSLASGTFTLKRLEWHIGDGDWTDVSIVADDVQVRFKLALTGLGPL